MTQAARHLHLIESEGASDPLIGCVIDGRYVVERVLGKGGMGLVYGARHHILGKRCAIKVLRPEVSRDADVMERFRREAQAASGIGSPHICDVSDFGVLPDGSTYFVMEMLEGPSLTKAMEQDRPLALPRILRIARQLCDALGAAHARGIVHRDLKPDNVHLVTHGSDADFVKVLDFGIAKVANSTDKKLTQAGQVFGTPHYMSPEQCAGRELDHRTDVYALGVMLYEMACGKVPFDADTLIGVLTKHVYEEPIPPHEITPVGAVPAGLEAVILKCLAKQATDRYASMAALRTDLDELERGEMPAAVREQVDRAARAMVGARASAHVAVSNAPVASRIAPEPARSSRTTLVAIAAALAMLVVAALAGGLVLLAPRAPVPPVAPIDPVEREPAPRVIAEVLPEVLPDVPPEQPGDVPAPALTVRLETDPPGAEVYDSSGAMLGNTPLALPRPEALAQYRVRAPGHREQALTLSPQTGSAITLRLVRDRRVRPDRPVPTVPEVTPLVPRDPPVTRPRVDPLGDGIIDPFGPPRR